MNDEYDASNMKLLHSSHIEVVPDAAYPGIFVLSLDSRSGPAVVGLQA